MGKYIRLENFLRQSNKDILVLSFSEIEKILGFDLPQSAYDYLAVWSNTKSHPIALSWLNAGYKSEQANITKRTVVFRKAETRQPEQKMRDVKQQPVGIASNTAVQLIRDYFNETIKDQHGRYMSWRHCYKVFSENRNATDKQIVDYLSLHLAFYLASWGMLRNSFLFYKDYKVHIPVVLIIQETKYDPLFSISAKELCKEENLNLIDEISKRIQLCYAKEKPSSESRTNNATDTLITKILLGTLGCVPAFDRYFKDSVKKYHVSNGTFNSSSIYQIAMFYCKYFDVFEELRCDLSQCGLEYPPMKLMDMCFWQDSYIDDLKRKK